MVWRFDRLPKSGAVPEHRVPYSGAIYLDRSGGTVSLMAKYDEAFHSENQKATQFECRDIALRGTASWAGHCNGWTAAAIRHAEPQKSVARNGVEFTPAEIKGLLAELYVYAETEFLGGIDTAINPGTLHVVLANWIGFGKHPIGVETTLGREVWNYPGYKFESESIVHDKNLVEVRLTLGCIDFLPYEVDQAPRKKRDWYFHYLLTLNEDGEITDGTYLYDSSQIDMLWAPMKPTQGGTEGNKDGNPYIDVDTIIGMWRESVPQEVRTAWYVVDPHPEDAVLVSDWFVVSPNADDARLEYIPDLTGERAAELESAVAVSPTEVEVAVTTDGARPVESGDDVVVEGNAPIVTEVEKKEREVEVFRERFADGAIKIEREVTLDDDFNYVDHGQFREWNQAGDLLAEGNFDLGKRTGLWRRAYAKSDRAAFSDAPFKGFTEPFVSTATFRNGKMHGTWSIVDKEDRTVSEIQLVDGVRHGQLRYYFPTGAAMREVDFDNGYVNGFLREYDKDGKVVLKRKYVDGHYTSTKVESFVSTAKKSETELLHPRMTVLSADDWWNVKFAEYGTQEGEPVRHGFQTVWYETGQQRFRGKFDLGEAVGELMWWHENGQVSRTGSYLSGQQDGNWTWWHPNGTKAVRGTYAKGVPTGRWLFWKPTGELEQMKDLGDGQANANPIEDASEAQRTDQILPRLVPQSVDAEAANAA